jgi:hypothetical protein
VGNAASVAEELNAHGAEGWELAGIWRDNMFVLKRVIAPKGIETHA